MRVALLLGLVTASACVTIACDSEDDCPGRMECGPHFEPSQPGSCELGSRQLCEHPEFGCAGWSYCTTESQPFHGECICDGLPNLGGAGGLAGNAGTAGAAGRPTAR